MPRLSIETAAEILRAAPEYCRGFSFGENSFYPAPLGDRWSEFVGKTIDLCRPVGRKVIVQDMGVVLSLWMSDRARFGHWFKPGNEKVLVAMLRTNNPSGRLINQASVVGLRQAGLMDDWGMSTQHWTWAWEQFRMEGSVPRDVLVRMDAAAAALGATYFLVEYGRDLVLEGKVSSSGRLWPQLPLEMMRRGLLEPPAAEQLVGLSPVAFRLRYNRAFDDEKNVNTSWPARRRDLRLTNGVFGHHFSLKALSPNNAYRKLANIDRGHEGLYAQTPYGFAAIVPELGPKEAVGIKTQIETDGYAILGPGDLRQAPSPDAKFFDIFRDAADELPARAEGVFCMTQKWGDAYRVYLIDSGYLEAEGAGTVLNISPGLSLSSVRDLISDETLSHQTTAAGAQVSVTVPPGGFRVLELK